MKLGSLFDGVGGWQLAGVRNGIKPVWSSEIETFPREVTKRRFPETKQLGDIRNINGAEIEPVEIITAGFPCQNLSQAGNRQGVINGTESGLFFDAVRIIRQMRVSTCGVYPKVCIFENVTGALSSNQGMDFRIMTNEKVDALNSMKLSMIHFAWDNYPDEHCYNQLKKYRDRFKLNGRNLTVYVLTNYNTTMEQDLERLYKLRSLDYTPYVMIFDKQHAPKEIRRMQRWCNNRFIWRSCERFEDYKG